MAGFYPKVLEKVLDFVSFQRKVNESELRKDFEEFCRRMRTEWYFQDEISKHFSEVPAFPLSPLGNHPKVIQIWKCIYVRLRTNFLVLLMSL